MEKTCVFCGLKPESKTKEHVIPKWLIEYTGDPKRQFYIGPLFGNDKIIKNISADQFQFPACDICNSRYSELEGKAKNTILEICENNQLASYDINNLLDWLDKVRIGLWLGYRYLNKDHWNINPNFYIDQRLSKADRIAYIYYLEGKEKGINFGSINGPVFAYMPCTFVLRINNYVFYNLSHINIVSARIGFPKITEIKIMKDGKSIVNQENGNNRIMVPVIRERFPITKNQFLQGIISNYVDLRNYLSIDSIKYIEKNSMFSNIGTSKIVNGYTNTWITEDKIQLDKTCNHGEMKNEYREIVKHCWNKQIELYSEMEFDSESWGSERIKELKYEQKKIIWAQKSLGYLSK